MAKRKGSPRKDRRTDLGQYLTRIREEQEKTQQEVADAIGRSRSYICKIETGQRERKSVPQKSLCGFVLCQLAQAYGANLAEVLEKADCPQLLLLDTNEEERQALIHHLTEIRQRSNQTR